jgi:arylsulfatase A-like enzyme
VRRRVLIVGVLAFAVAVLGPTSPAWAAPPNVVVVLTDDQRWDTLSAMPAVQSRLVAKGVTFTNAFAVNPLCCPSRASLLTGKYSHSTGVYQNVPPNGGFRSFRDGSTIATWLRRVGYRTGYFGKYLNGYRSSYVPPGWSRWLAFTSPGYYRYGLNADGALDPRRNRTEYSTDRLAQAVQRFVRTGRRPFFAVFAPFAPHRPATPAARHVNAFPDLEPWRPPSHNEADLSDKPAWIQTAPFRGEGTDQFRRRQYSSLLAVDEAVDRIVDTLAASRRLANTVVIYTSDNGYLWGEHRLIDKSVPYEESIRVPLVVRGPGVVPAQIESRHVANIDLAPTIAALARTRAPGANGKSLVPFLRADPVSSWRAQLLVEGASALLPSYCALRRDELSLVVWATGEQELYDLAADPYQLQSLHADPAWAPTLAALRSRLARTCHPTPPRFARTLLCTHEGTSGPDSLAGGSGFDILCGRDGDDRLNPGGGADLVYGAGGADVIVVREGLRDTVRCGSGTDTAIVDRFDVVRLCEPVRRP